MKNPQSLDIPISLENPECLPSYASHGAAGADVKAYIKNEITLSPKTSILIPTGVRVAVPEGYEIQVRPRSGLALKNQITVLNTPGTIDADYRGEIGVILINHGEEDFVIKPGMRIAQIILAPVIRANFLPCDQLCETTRGANGFGHTGFH